VWYLISILEEFRLKLRGSNVVGSYLICTLASRGYPRPVGNIPAGDRERSLDPLTAGIFPARSGISPPATNSLQVILEFSPYATEAALLDVFAGSE
jgi:hypothetical protein